MKKRFLIPIVWGLVVAITLVVGWISWFKYQAIPDTLITVVCGTEGLVIGITGIIGVVELLKGDKKDENSRQDL